MQKNTREICRIAGFKITETVRSRGKQSESVFHIRKLDDEITSREFKYLEQPLKLMKDLEAYVNYSRNQSQNQG